MIAIGLGLAWAGYTIGMWGYCLVRDYNVTITDLFRATWPGPGGAAAGPGTVSSSVVPTKSGQLSAQQQRIRQYLGQQ
jgi:hypothetical protein